MSKQKRKDPIAELAEIIKANPKCIAIVDNDCWDLYKKDPYKGNRQDDESNRLASSDTHGENTGGYGSGSCYGGDLLQALARLQGITVESV